MNKRNFIEWINERIASDDEVDGEMDGEILMFSIKMGVSVEFAERILRRKLDHDFLLKVANLVKDGHINGSKTRILEIILERRRKRRVEYLPYKTFMIAEKRCVNVSMDAGVYFSGEKTSFTIPEKSKIEESPELLKEASEDPRIDYMICSTTSSKEFYHPKAVFILTNVKSKELLFFNITPPIESFPR